MNTMEEKVNMDLTSPSEHLCYVRCNFCNTVLAVVIPCKRLLETVTVKCGHCGNVSFLSTRPPLQGQCLDHQITLQGYNFMDKPTTGSLCGTSNGDVHKKGQPSSSSSSASTDPVSPRPFVVKPPEKKHRLPSAYNRFMKYASTFIFNTEYYLACDRRMHITKTYKPQKHGGDTAHKSSKP
ncbi:hypothetical protein RND81_07G176400 [Saponaria officinalis]|uniref:CRABS CLAW n=1 Tax=Saponaria officinalis TaxID=3572 RepID=A0AAW1JPP8_SAPOF